jgi:hypothetical protein
LASDEYNYTANDGEEDFFKVTQVLTQT